SRRCLAWRHGHFSTYRHGSAERLPTGTYTCVYFGIGRGEAECAHALTGIKRGRAEGDGFFGIIRRTRTVKAV
ncbi:MAG: hypothetical protein WB496_14755, partial [Pseudolabrys sp.]